MESTEIYKNQMSLNKMIAKAEKVLKEKIIVSEKRKRRKRIR